MSFQLKNIVRKNILDLVPYSSARNEYSGKASIFLDANENPYNSPYNRYPDPQQRLLKERVASLYKVPAENIFLGNGSDEAIDISFRIFCEPGKDNVLSMHPSYGMYKVCADINNIEFRKVLLNDGDFSLNPGRIIEYSDESSKIVFLCSPNNPTANLLKTESIRKLLNEFNGIIVVDEAYIDFADSEGMLPYLDEYPNLIVMRTFSKAWGLAAIRLGMAFASAEIINLFNGVKYPYNLNKLTQDFALERVTDYNDTRTWVDEIRDQREILSEKLEKLNFVEKVYPSDANFLLVRMQNAREVYNYLKEKSIIVRDRSRIVLCEGSLRITVGTPGENELLLQELGNYEKP
jgi:histidinol-phosphate aminotransferase